VQPLDRRGYDLFNVLLLGSDGEITNDGFVRTDTMIILSINRTTNSVAMLSLPRDLFVYIPAWGMQRINLTYARGQSGGWHDGTFELLRQMILYNFGINVHYYAMIDLSGFVELIDMVGGVELAVDCAIEDLPLVGAELPAAARRVNDDGYHVLDVGYYHFSGAEALWYARSRYNSTDFDRGRRQMQILRALWRKARDTGQLANLPALWSQGMEVVETNLGFEDMLGLLPLALSLDTRLIESFPLVRTYHTTPWQTPSGDFVQLPVYDTLRMLLDDFYTPPTTSQLVLDAAEIRVYNGTTHADWDRVAAERLGWDGLQAIAAGSADQIDHARTVLIDYKGGSKGSSRGEIARILNIRPENILISPDPARDVDFEVILGDDYSSCTFSVLPVSD
jgi:LCP family protein required for cell wall assembly